MKILPCGGVKVSNRPAAHGKLSTHRRSLGIEGEERKLITDKGADKVRVTVGLLGEPGVFDQGVDVDTVEKFLVLALYTFVLVADSQAPLARSICASIPSCTSPLRSSIFSLATIMR